MMERRPGISHENRKEKIKHVRDSLQVVINEGSVPYHEGQLYIRSDKLFIISQSFLTKTYELADPNVFAFQGWLGHEGNMAVIGWLQATDPLKKTIIEVWEKTWRDHGVTSFSANRVSHAERGFWQELGYIQKPLITNTKISDMMYFPRSLYKKL